MKAARIIATVIATPVVGFILFFGYKVFEPTFTKPLTAAESKACNYCDLTPSTADLRRAADLIGTSRDRLAKEKEERQKNMTQAEKIEDNCNEEHKLADYSPNHIVKWCVIRGQRAAGIYVEPTTQETTNTETTAPAIDVSKGLVEPTPIEQQPATEKETTKQAAARLAVTLPEGDQ